jgi:conjugative transfer region protein TrbK
MDSKTIARVGAIVFVAIAITMAALEMRDDPKPAPADSVVTVMEPDGDPLPATLRYCASLGEAGATDRQCLDAWAENRRRFLSPQTKSRGVPTTAAPTMPNDGHIANDAPPLTEGTR